MLMVVLMMMLVVMLVVVLVVMFFAVSMTMLVMMFVCHTLVVTDSCFRMILKVCCKGMTILLQLGCKERIAGEIFGISLTSFGNAQINLAFRSLIRTFVPMKLDHETCESLLEAHGIKPTANRIVVVKTLAEAAQPMSLSELEYEILSIDKSGVFRALTLFREHHLVHVLEDGGDGVRYELCYSHDGHEHDDDQHVHFYCEQCHRTFCIHDVPIPAVTLPDGYTLTSINYMAKGLCPACGRR